MRGIHRRSTDSPHKGPSNTKSVSKSWRHHYVSLTCGFWTFWTDMCRSQVVGWGPPDPWCWESLGRTGAWRTSYCRGWDAPRKQRVNLIGTMTRRHETTVRSKSYRQDPRHHVFCWQYPSGPLFIQRISWSLEGARFGFKLFQSLWNLTGMSAAALPICLSNFRTMWSS